MFVEKIINNNVISARDEKGSELVIMGRGIGFGQKIGNKVPDEKIEKIFRLENIEDTERFEKMLASLPIEYIRISDHIIDYAREALGIQLNPNVYLSLTDHISFAIERKKEGMIFSNAVSEEVKLFYPNEYIIGKHALYLIESETGYLLEEDEAAAIALHILNAELNTEIGNTFLIIKMMREMMEIIEENTDAQKAAYPRDRLITNIKYLARRLLSEEPIKGREDFRLYQFVKMNYPDEYSLIDKINRYIEETYHCSMTEEEKIYLALNVKRMKDLYIL